MDWAVLAAFGVQNKLVHWDHSNNLAQNNSGQHTDMIESATGITRFPGFNPGVVFDDQTNLAGSISNFKAAAEASSATDHLYFICAGPMEVAWRCINAVTVAKRQFITCISHSYWNDNFTGPNSTHT